MKCWPSVMEQWRIWDCSKNLSFFWKNSKLTIFAKSSITDDWYGPKYAVAEKWLYCYLRGCLQISLLILSELNQINQLLFPLKSSVIIRRNRSWLIYLNSLNPWNTWLHKFHGLKPLSHALLEVHYEKFWQFAQMYLVVQTCAGKINSRTNYCRKNVCRIFEKMFFLKNNCKEWVCKTWVCWKFGYFFRVSLPKWPFISKF